jgi:hypothetical protein
VSHQYTGSCGFEIHQGHREFERIKKDYDALSEKESDGRGYERVLYDLLVQLVHRMDRTIATNKKTVEKDNQPRPIKPVDQARLDALKQQEAGAYFPQNRIDLCLALADVHGLVMVMCLFVMQNALKSPRSLRWTEMQMDRLP